MLNNTDTIPDDILDRHRWPELYEIEEPDDSFDPRYDEFRDMEMFEK